MNEKTREMWKQAVLDNTTTPMNWQVVADQFAEMIIKEMCGMMEQCQDDCDTGDASETNWGYISQLQDWINIFKQHFGVE